jgi:hypothetical protein
MYQSSAEPIILSYKRRRYDGGPEMELIAYLEAQHQQKTLSGYSELDELMADYDDMAPTAHHAAKHKSLWQQVGEVLCMGPLEIFVGLLGMITTGIAATTFKTLMNPALTAQSRAVYDDCWDTCKQGLAHTLKAPGLVWSLLRAG